MRAVKSVSIDSERRVIITYLDGSTETLYPNCIWCDSDALRQLIKDLLEEKADAITQTIENVTIASFADGADEGLVKKLLVSIEPIQEGTGDPSPENVRPISGRTGSNAWRTGKNLLPMPIVSGSYDYTTTVTVNDDKSFVISKTSASGWTTFILGEFTLKPGTYTLIESADDNANTQLVLGKVIGGTTEALVSTRYSKRQTFTIESDTLVRARYLRSAMADNVLTKLMLFIGNTATATDYEPYKGSTYSVNWETEARTVYGGTIDVVSGKLTVDSEYIASYNGETLPATWISDRDVYAEGTTPTTGAQVVYKLSEPVEYQISANEITTLLGDNNIWADSGNILELEYTADTKLYIGESQVGRTSSAQQSVNRPVEFDTSIVKPVTEVTEKEQIEEEE